MRLRLFLVFAFALGALAAWACSLNPQPYPPDEYDAASDATMNAAPDGAGGESDSSTGSDAMPTPADAASDGAAEDAGDAGDATDDALDAGDAE